MIKKHQLHEQKLLTIPQLPAVISKITGHTATLVEIQRNNLKVNTFKTITKYSKFEFNGNFILAYKLSIDTDYSHIFYVPNYIVNINE